MFGGPISMRSRLFRILHSSYTCVKIMLSFISKFPLYIIDGVATYRCRYQAFNIQSCQGFNRKNRSRFKSISKFVEIYNEACQRLVGINDKFDESNLQMRQHIRDNLIKNGYIFVDPKDVDSIYITQKAMDDYDILHEEKW